MDKKGIVEEKEYSEDEMFIHEEILSSRLKEKLVLCEFDNLSSERIEVEVAAYNLAAYYEEIGKYSLALKYYTLSKEYGCNFVDEKIDALKDYL